MNSFTDKLKGEAAIFALCEAYAGEYATSLKKTTEAVEDGVQDKPVGDDVFNPDDLFNTVDVQEETPVEGGPSFSAEDITLSSEQKESVKKRLTEVLNEIQDKESISEPALEMIVNEVANETSYLTESEEASLVGPVEKQKYRVGLIEAIKKFINELLGVTVEQDGVMPEDVDNLGTGEGGEGSEGAEGSEGGEGTGESGEGSEGAEEAGEGAGEGSEEKKEEDEEGKSALNESSDGSEAAGEGSDDNEVKPEAAMQEGVCQECGEEGVVDVNPDEVIQVIDDNDPLVTPIAEPTTGDAGPVIGDGDSDDVMGAGLSDDAPLTVGVLKELVSKILTESANGEKSFADLWKNLAGNPIVLSKPSNTKGEQKTADPKGKAPDGTKYESPKDETGTAPELPKPSNTKGEQKTADPKGNPSEGTEYETPNAPKAGGATVAKKPTMEKKEAANIAAAISESSDKSAVSFLQEAAAAIKNAKKSLQS